MNRGYSHKIMNKPNIIFLMADTVMRSALSCYGSPFIKTPHIDSLCKQSYQFENLYQPANMCKPSRSCWWTGYYQNHHQVFHNRQVYDRKVPTIFKSLADQNYYGGFLGLFHCWRGEQHDGLDDWSWLDYDDDHPFDGHEERWESIRQYASDHGFYLTEEHLKDFRNHAGYTDFPIEQHKTTKITDKAIECINDFQDDRPNALWVSYWMPHEPFAPPVPYNERYPINEVVLPGNVNDDRSGRPEHHSHPDLTRIEGIENEEQLKRVWSAYAGMMTFVDDQIGRIIQHLKENNLYDDAIIVFSTDHGTTMGSHGWMYKGQSYMVEEISHIPCMMKLPQQQYQICVQDVVSSTDFTPTILDILGLPYNHCHGQSWQQDIFKGQSRENPYALGMHDGEGQEHSPAVRMLRKGDWKYNMYSLPGVEELYNIAKDPLELENCANQQTQQCETMRAELTNILSAQNDAFAFWS